MSLLQAHNLGKCYGPFQALTDVSLDLDKGEVVGFLGPNGAGKTTTMKILSGFVSPSAGTATICGHDIVSDSLAARRQIGYLPQELPLYKDMRVVDYLDHVARIKSVTANERRHAVFSAMERTDLLPVQKRHIHKLSGGNRQRVGLAQALLGKPAILILDEPTAGLDPAQVANFRELITELASDHSILLSTHIMSEVEYCCQRVVMINQGRDILQESIEQWQNRSHDIECYRVRLQSDNYAAFIQACEQATWCQEVKHDGINLTLQLGNNDTTPLITLAQQFGGLRELIEERRSLEEVFRDLIKQPA